MTESFVASIPLPEFSPWKKVDGKGALISFEIELTNRCNNNCRHCYINLPAGDHTAKGKELSIAEIDSLADEAVSLGALWCLLTGGEPLIREDFCDIYLCLKKKGLLVSVFTNATLITPEHIKLFKKYPPRDVEISVYGVTQNTYERVTGKPGSFSAFMRGLGLLLEGGLKVRLKAMALRSNVHELPAISRFCREKTKDYFRFDPFLHLRFDANPVKNAQIRSERLSPEEIIVLERSDPDRFQALEKSCNDFSAPEDSNGNNSLLGCGAGMGSCCISYDGLFRLCSSLWHADCLYDLRTGNLTDAFHNFVPRVRSVRSKNKAFIGKCRICPLINLCMWCPAHAHLETGEMDVPVDYFCETAHARARMLNLG